MSRRRHGKSTLTHKVLLAFCGGLLALALVALGVGAWAGSYLRSHEFRELLAGHLGQALGGQAVVKPLKWDGSGVFSEGIQLEGKEASPLSRLEARQLRAAVDWRSVFSGVWKVRAIEILEIEAAMRPWPQKSESPDPSSLPLPQAPFRLEVEGFKATKATLDFGMGGALRETQLFAEHQPDGWAFVVSGGKFLAVGWPEIQVDKLRGRISGETLFLTSGAGHLEAGGKVQASGEFSRESELLLEWEQVNTDSLFPQSWREHVQGSMNGNATLLFQPAGRTAEGHLVIQEGRLRDVPLLSQIATFTGSPQFRRMPLQEASADFRRGPEGWKFRRVNVESKGLLRITGEVDISADGGLAGVLEVGVAPQSLQWIPGSRERVFTRNEQGYVWTSMRLSGTLDNPQEDLSARLAAAARDEILQRGTEILEKPAEAARGILEALSPLLR